ncbi:MAG: hypothetical protein QOE34_913 [Verrucomicrobiota bacterium]
MNHYGIEGSVRTEKRPHRFRRNIPATRESNVWMKRAQIGLESRSDRGFLHPLVELKKMRMAVADSNPKNVRTSFAGKCPKAANGKEESFPLDRVEIFLEGFFSLVRNVAEKTKSEMHLFRREPADAAHVRIQLRQASRNRFRKLDANEEPFRAHS